MEPLGLRPSGATIARRSGAPRPPWTNVDTETAFRHDHCKTHVHIQKVNISEVRGQLIRSNSRIFSTTSSYMLSVTDFDPKLKEPFPRSEFTLALNLDILDAGQSPNAVSVHARTSQVDFEVDRPPPAACPPGDFLITMVKETVILYKKEFRNMKKSRISHWSESDENAKWLWDCLWLCQACKRGFTYVGLCKEIFARKHTATHKPTSAQSLIVTTMTHTW